MAILLVLFRHHHSIPFLEKIGWIGVDLFFVLSGFLVSGLLFQEYKKFKSISPGRFLIRRGFKIYPLFYLYLVTTVVIEQVFFYGVNKMALLSDLIFIQSYHFGIWPHTWSLAVEEHFYLGLTFLVVLLIKNNQLEKGRNITFLFLGLSLLSLCLRIYTVISYQYTNLTHHFATHLRMDSLLCGVLIAYYYFFKKNSFVVFFQRNRKLFYCLSALLLSPVFILPEEHAYTNTFGVTFIYTGFGIILCLFITDNHINRKLNHLFGRQFINLISFIGYCSYAIYLFHFPLLKYTLALGLSSQFNFLVYFIGSIATGMILSQTVEHQILVLKDKWFPKRELVPVVQQSKEKAMA
jgi:peptidoglycan/LPS O-acetylase OafA/YrhL